MGEKAEREEAERKEREEAEAKAQEEIEKAEKERIEKEKQEAEQEESNLIKQLTIVARRPTTVPKPRLSIVTEHTTDSQSKRDREYEELDPFHRLDSKRFDKITKALSEEEI